MACLMALSLWTVAILNSVKHGDKNDDNGEEWEGRMGMVDASLPILWNTAAQIEQMLHKRFEIIWAKRTDGETGLLKQPPSCRRPRSRATEADGGGKKLSTTRGVGGDTSPP
jgi:hypothetical protein